MATEQDFGETFALYQDPSTLPTPGIIAEHVDEGRAYHAPQLDDTYREKIKEQLADTILESVEYDDIKDGAHHGSTSGSARNSSGFSGNEGVFDDDAPRSSPTTSHHSDNDMDEIMSVMPDAADDLLYTSRKSVSSPYAPMKQRSPFRKTSSVRALQMETTPPPQPTSRPFSPYMGSPRAQHFKISTPSRTGTPRSQSRRLGTGKKKEYPLVLLHVTLLPLVMPCSIEIMSAVLPEHIMENYKLLQDKITETVLDRGILLPHPREDYDVLEERLLESLELKLPRILKCGHFHLSEEEAAEIEEDDLYHSDDEDLDICGDCGRRVRDGKMGSGSGNRRWNIKIFAANGLMRAGAWTAAWREMERVDVEVTPWIPEDMKRELEARKEMHEEEEEEEARHRTARETTTGHTEETVPRLVRTPSEAERLRLREIYGHSMPPEIMENVEQDDDAAALPSAQVPRTAWSQKRTRHAPSQDVPLSTLLQNYLVLLARDRRNIAIALLSLLVLLLSMNGGAAAARSVGTELSASAVEYPMVSVSPSVVAPTATPDVFMKANVPDTNEMPLAEPPQEEPAQEQQQAEILPVDHLVEDELPFDLHHHDI
ncbi:MAG: hypothetical protein M4579_001655 [Chaenotheca gracillima]|nr:MAG: hypothetical protein M4579_001655 [Chaenotheca gracillima]